MCGVYSWRLLWEPQWGFFNKMSSEARVPLSFPIHTVRRCFFLFQGRIKIRYFVCVSVMVWHLEPRGLRKWEQWCQLMRCLYAGLYKTSKFTALSWDGYLKHGQTCMFITQVSNMLLLYFLYLHATCTQYVDREARYIVFECVRSYHIRLLVIK